MLKEIVFCDNVVPLKINSHHNRFIKITKKGIDSTEVDVIERLLYKVYKDKQIVFINDASRD